MSILIKKHPYMRKIRKIGSVKVNGNFIADCYDGNVKAAEEYLTHNNINRQEYHYSLLGALRGEAKHSKDYAKIAKLLFDYQDKRMIGSALYKIAISNDEVDKLLKNVKKRNGWNIINLPNDAIRVYHFGTDLAHIVNSNYRIGYSDLVVVKLEQGYSLTDRRFIKALLSDDDYKAFKRWAGKTKRYNK